MKIAYGDSRTARKWKNNEISWEDFCERVSTTQYTTETVEEYRKMTKARRDAIKDVGGYVAGHLKGGRRKVGHVLCRSMLTLDMDNGMPGILDELKMLTDYRMCIYSTHKHTPDAPRLRLVIPMTREVSEDEYPAVGRKVAQEIGMDLFDDSTYEPNRLMYWPSTSSNGEYVYEVLDGELLDPDVYLAKYDDWRDISTWPVSSRESEVVKAAVNKVADPLGKEGIVGVFCRTYTIRDAIEKFLPDVYEPSVMEGRYDYIPADSSAGVQIIEEKFSYSHHATDPACGMLLNAFDVVRVHKFPDDDPKKSSLAQFILESGYGKSELAQNANNIFGMKCSLSGNTWSGSAWDGKSKYMKKTQEQHTDGSYETITADFRKYPCIEDSIADHSAYLLGAKNGKKLRYDGVKGCTDYKKAVQIIKDGGYATSLTYVEKLCSIIERWNLTQYDAKDSVGEVIRWYRVRKNWTDSKSQKGAFKILDNAKKCADQNPGYKVFDADGNVVYEPKVAEPAVEVPFLVKVSISDLNIRRGPGVDFARVQFIPIGVYTIVEVKSGKGASAWGRLKSGIGWISLDFVRKI